MEAWRYELYHSSGPWKNHKYIKKIGNRYIYAKKKIGDYISDNITGSDYEAYMNKWKETENNYRKFEKWDKDAGDDDSYYSYLAENAQKHGEYWAKLYETTLFGKVKKYVNRGKRAVNVLLGKE